MAHIDLSHADMKPGALIRYEIAQEATQAKQLLVAAIISTAMILVVVALFMDMLL
ncbi:MAG: hypothetical protein ABL879_04100 [Devosia sp.]